MSTTESSEQTAEQRSTPIGEAGCETKIDRGVQGTAHSADFAKHRARACQMLYDAIVFGHDAFKAKEFVLLNLWEVVEVACRNLTDMIDARSGCEEHKPGGS